MSKLQQEIVLKDKYSNDTVMSRLLECNHDIKHINHSLKHCGSIEFTLEEIGLILGVSRERVRQIEASAIKKLKHPKIGRILKTYLAM